MCTCVCFISFSFSLSLFVTCTRISLYSPFLSPGGPLLLYYFFLFWRDRIIIFIQYFLLLSYCPIPHSDFLFPRPLPVLFWPLPKNTLPFHIVIVIVAIILFLCSSSQNLPHPCIIIIIITLFFRFIKTLIIIIMKIFIQTLTLMTYSFCQYLILFFAIRFPKQRFQFHHFFLGAAVDGTSNLLKCSSFSVPLTSPSRSGHSTM